MANYEEQAKTAVFATDNINRCAKVGLTAASITGLANFAALITEIKALRDQAGTLEATYVYWEALLQGLQVLYNTKVISDTQAAALVSVNLNNGLATDLLSLAGTNAPSTYNITTQAVAVFDAIQVFG